MISKTIQLKVLVRETNKFGQPLWYLEIVIITEFWLMPSVSTHDPIISPRALALSLKMVEG